LFDSSSMKTGHQIKLKKQLDTLKQSLTITPPTLMPQPKASVPRTQQNLSIPPSPLPARTTSTSVPQQDSDVANKTEQNTQTNSNFSSNGGEDYNRERALKVLVLGDSNVGKSSLINTYVNSNFSSSTRPTIGADFLSKKKIQLESGESFILHLWDTAGQERYHSLGGVFYRNAHCCLLVFDVCNIKSFQHLENWRQECIILSKVKDETKFSFVVVGNKADMPTPHRNVTTQMAQTWCLQRNIPYIETSAKDHLNVERAFQIAVQNALKYHPLQSVATNTTKKSQTTQQNSCSC